MIELLRTNDPVRISWLTAVLAQSGIEAVVLDTHTSVLEGQIAAIQRRIMVYDEDYQAAVDLLAVAEQERVDAVAQRESMDSLLGGRLLLHQPEEGYRVAVDPVLLAAAVPEAGDAAAPVLDVGTGVGAAALCYGYRVAGARVVGLELQPELARLAHRNAAANAMEDRVTVIEGDLLHPPEGIAGERFTHVMANPPHLPPERADPRTGAGKAASHVEGAARLADWIDFCLRAVSGDGTVTLIHRADRLDEILALLAGRAGGTVVFPLWPRREQAPKRVIVSTRPGSRAPMRLDPGMVLHEDDGRFTRLAAAVLSEGAALPL